MNQARSVAGRPGWQALLIDLDGTLVDTLPSLRAAYRDFLERRGRTPSDAEFSLLNGPKLDEMVAHLKAAHGLAEPSADLFAAYLAGLEQQYVPTASPMTGAVELLAAAREMGLMLALVTSAPRSVVVRLLHRLGWAVSFDAVVCGDEVSQGKPAPDIYLKAIDALKVSADATLAIEDSENGVEAARAAGARPIRVGSDDYPTLSAVIQLIRSFRPLTVS